MKGGMMEMMVTRPEARLAEAALMALLTTSAVPTEAEAEMMVRASFGLAAKFAEVGKSLGFIRIIEAPEEK